MSNVVQFPDSADKRTSEDFLKSIVALHILDELPFVGPTEPGDTRSGVPRRNYWIDKPTSSGNDDFLRGRRYAKMTIAAMQKRSDECNGHKLALSICAVDLEHIISGMIKDGVARCRKGGPRSRTPVTSAMSGFLSEITRYVAGIREVQS